MIPSSKPELTLGDITYEWVEECSDVGELKQAVRLILDDGDFFSQLREVIEDKICRLEGKTKPTMQEANEEFRKEQESLSSWIKKGEKPSANDERKAEAEKTKGNEAMAAGDAAEAIGHYTSAIKLSEKAAYLGNRAAAYMKLKDFRSALKDAQRAKELDSGYLKAYYRVAKAQEALGNLLAACCELTILARKAPDNADALGELHKMRSKLSTEDLKNLEIFELQKKTNDGEKKKTGVKIEIQEDEDEEEAEKKEEENKEEKKKESEPNPTPEAKPSEQGTSAKPSPFPQPEPSLEKLSPEVESAIKEIETAKEAISERIKRADFEGSAKDLEALLERAGGLGDSRTLNRVKMAIHNNVALCYKQTGLDQQALSHCAIVVDHFLPQRLGLDEESIGLLLKALVRRGMSFERLGKFGLAYVDFRSTLRLQITNSQARDGVRRAEQHLSPEEIMKLNARVEKLFPAPSLPETFSETKLAENVHYFTKKAEESPQEGKVEPTVEKQEEPKVEPEKVEIVEKKEETSGNNTTPLKPPLKDQPFISPKNSPQGKEEFSLVISLNDIELAEIKRLKTLGNEKFSSGDFKSAEAIYSEALMSMGLSSTEQELSFTNSVDKELMVDILSNRALNYLNLGHPEKGLLDAKLAHKIRPTPKTKYRVLANSEPLLAAKVESLIRTHQSGEAETTAAKNLLKETRELEEVLAEVVLQGGSNQKLAEMKTRLSGSVQALEKLVKSGEKAARVHHEPSPVAETTPKVAPKPKEVSPISEVSQSKQRILETTSEITKKGIKNLLESDEKPKTSSAFETELLSFKDEYAMAFAYLRKLGPQLIEGLYRSRQVEVKVLLRVLKCLEESLKGLDLEGHLFGFKLLQALGKTKGMRLGSKMLVEKERDLIRKLINKTSEAGVSPAEKQELFNAYAL